MNTVEDVEYHTSSQRAMAAAVKLAVEPDRILFIDDSEDDCRIFTLLTSAHNCVLETARDGREGVAMVERGNYKIVFVDINLGVGMDGVEVFKRVRALKEGDGMPTVVVFSGYLTNEVISDCQKIGFVSFVNKRDGLNQLFFNDMLRAFGVKRK